MNQSEFFKKKIRAKKFELEKKKRSFEEALMESLPLEDAYLDKKGNLIVEVEEESTPLYGMKRQEFRRSLSGIPWVVRVSTIDEVMLEIVINTQIATREESQIKKIKPVVGFII